MKYVKLMKGKANYGVALFTRAWIEIFILFGQLSTSSVALFTRAWIEMRIPTRVD